MAKTLSCSVGSNGQSYQHCLTAMGHLTASKWIYSLEKTPLQLGFFAEPMASISIATRGARTATVRLILPNNEVLEDNPPVNHPSSQLISNPFHCWWFFEHELMLQKSQYNQRGLYMKPQEQSKNLLHITFWLVRSFEEKQQQIIPRT